MNGDALKLLRQYHCMKSVELCAALKFSSSYVSSLEIRRRGIPLTAIYAYAKFFKVTIEEVEELAAALASDDKMTLSNPKLQRVYLWWLDVQEYKEAS